jgi:hypothetical protein
LIAGGISGFIAEAISYQRVFAITVAIALISVAVIVKTLTKQIGTIKPKTRRG